MTTQFAYTHNIIDCLDTGVFVVDKHFTVQLWNKFMEVHSDFTESEIIGKNFLNVSLSYLKNGLRGKYIASLCLIMNRICHGSSALIYCSFHMAGL
ncbi:PAS domain-containing protein [Psychromonas sp. KJ10-2]|uniref:PAS domain-containing protein n=1 Tax=Psychromonas sp. KJ10-2 TaxID=3391822 RepID=UPI0039B4EF10